MELNQKQFVYSIPVGLQIAGQTRIYRNPKFSQKLLQIPPNITNLADFWDQSLTKYENCLLLQSLTYKDVEKLAKSLGSWLLEQKHQKIYLYAKNNPEWTITDIACWNYGIVNIPLYDTLGAQAFHHTLKLTQGTVVFTTNDLIPSLLRNIENHKQSIKIIVFLDQPTLLQLKNIQKLGLQTQTIKKLFQHSIIERPKMNIDNHITYMFTSGTTGLPKGVVGTHRMFISQVLAMKGHFQYEQGDIHLSFLPIAHSFERFITFVCIWSGSIIKYSQYPITQITKDLMRTKPTILPIVPRLLHKFYPICKAIYEKQKNAIKIKGLFGGHLRKMVTGSAPVSAEVLKFFSEVLQCDIRQGYGQTQTTAATFITFQGDTNYGHVGGINACSQFKLVDVPQMNCLTSENPPRGQVCTRGDSIFKNYYLDEKNTKQTIDEQGWNHTGDIGIILPNGALKIVDRKKNIYKLSQGQYIAPQKIENIYLRSPYVAQCFIYGDSLQSYNIAIIHPNLQVLQVVAKKMNLNESLQNLIENKYIEEHFLQELLQHGKKQGLFGFELAKKVKLWPVSFRDLGIFTSTMKLQRQVAKKVFMKQIQQMYKNH